MVIMLRLFDLDANCLSRAANWRRFWLRIGLGPDIGKWEWGWWRGTRDACDGGLTRSWYPFNGLKMGGLLFRRRGRDLGMGYLEKGSYWAALHIVEA